MDVLDIFLRVCLWGQHSPDGDLAFLGPVRRVAFRQRKAEPAEAATDAEAGIRSPTAELR